MLAAAAAALAAAAAVAAASAASICKIKFEVLFLKVNPLIKFVKEKNIWLKIDKLEL